ncbi:MAG: SH3 domain-containing protein [Azospirillum sp.]|nr:SH3 domain-containing protein [Azospirillum sp.]
MVLLLAILLLRPSDEAQTAQEMAVVPVRPAAGSGTTGPGAMVSPPSPSLPVPASAAAQARPGKPAAASGASGPESLNSLAAASALLQIPAPQLDLSLAKTPIRVDSFGSGSYPLTDWPIEATVTTGWLDSVTVESPEKRPLRDDDVLVLAGWAGESGIGIRVSYVVFSFCGQVVGAVAVGESRPDVAQTVHPNLRNSGWHARLLVGHLPRCGESMLEAWSVNLAASGLFPLNGRIGLALPDRKQSSAIDSFVAAPVFKPGDGTPIAVVAFTVRARSLNIRRGPGTDFGVAGDLPAGKYTGYVLDSEDGWVQVIAGDKAGWGSSRYIELDH